MFYLHCHGFTLDLYSTDLCTGSNLSKMLTLTYTWDAPYLLSVETQILFVIAVFVQLIPVSSHLPRMFSLGKDVINLSMIADAWCLVFSNLVHQYDLRISFCIVKCTSAYTNYSPLLTMKIKPIIIVQCHGNKNL